MISSLCDLKNIYYELISQRLIISNDFISHFERDLLIVTDVLERDLSPLSDQTDCLIFTPVQLI